jgi:hypothetical protein
MIGDLSMTLGAMLSDAALPALVRTAHVAFERPADSYKPDHATINLFLYDVREMTELRSNEPVIARQNGMTTIRQPPLRLACSYQVTAWAEPGTTGDQAVFDQHQLLGETLKAFGRSAAVPDRFLQGDLKTQVYPVSLVAGQADLVRNPAEFWTAMGGKLRPSFTLTAVIALESGHDPITAPDVTSKTLRLGEIDLAAADAGTMRLRDPDGAAADATTSIGGVVTDATSHAAIAAVDLTVVETGTHVQTKSDGRFRFGGMLAGHYSIRAAKAGYVTRTVPVDVPGRDPESFAIELSPSP